MHVRYKFLLIAISICSFGFLNTTGDDRGDSLRKTTDDTDRNFTTVGNIALTVSNFGTIGTRNAYWPNQPSCEYPIGSRIEHLYQGGLWVGAEIRSSNSVRDGQHAVSTASSDRVSTTTGKGFEFVSIPGTSIIQRSTLSESQYFSESAVSHQDFVGVYTDTTPRDSSQPDAPVPLGVTVTQESYAWNYPFADFFVILNYKIYNTGRDTLDSVYVGLWANGVVQNTNNVRPGTSGYFNFGGNGYSDTLRMMYTFDYGGAIAPTQADSYIGFKLLGMIPFPRGVDSLGNLKNRTYYNAWTFNSSSGDPAYFSPQLDYGSNNGERSRYDRMASSLAADKIALLRTRAGNSTTLLSTGPFNSLRPGDSLMVVYGVICGRKYGTDPARLDTRLQRKTLYSNAAFAQQAYDGEDVKGNNIYDPAEDINGNGKLDHFVLPQPPRPPKVKAVVESQKVTIYWDKSTAENSIDPITRRTSFEGYRIYRSTAGADFLNPDSYLLNLPLVGEFDRTDDNIGYNTGFGRIALTQAKRFAGDTVDYWYRFPPSQDNVPNLNGWQYVYGVAAFSPGDSATGISSLQSKTIIVRAIPGTDTASVKNKNVGVYPNPYYVNAYWDGGTERTRKIYFYNLPARCQIKVYTLAGDVVADMQHDASTYNGTDIQWFQRFGGTQTTPQFSGGEHAWDLITKFDQAIATGLYLFTVKNADTGEIKTGKFLIIK